LLLSCAVPLCGMSINQSKHGQTYVTQSFPWGLYLRNGHRLLCSDGRIRAAELAQTADTFFSIPASVRINGKHVSGFCSVTESHGTAVYVFHAHTVHGLPDFPEGEERDKMILSAQ